MERLVVVLQLLTIGLVAFQMRDVGGPQHNNFGMQTVLRGCNGGQKILDYDNNVNLVVGSNSTVTLTLVIVNKG